MATTVKMPMPMDKIAEFCERWHIAEFALFGSVVEDHFGVDSDGDVLVEFAEVTKYTFHDLLDMEDELVAIFGRSVDLIDKVALQQSRNYLRRQNIFGSAQVIYARR